MLYFLSTLKSLLKKTMPPVPQLFLYQMGQLLAVAAAAAANKMTRCLILALG